MILSQPNASDHIGNRFTLSNSDAVAVDGWRSNLVIDETNTYINASNGTQTIDVLNFNFYARRTGDPLTPFVARRNSDNQFTILAVGTSRSNYAIGENRMAFDLSGVRRVTLAAGQTLVVGFLDANANGSGGGTRSVIPFDWNGAQIWYSGGHAGNMSASVTEGNAPQPGSRTLTHLRRDYRFNFSMSVNAGS